MSHHPDVLHRELAWLAYHFHWSLDDLLDLEHAERRRFATEIDWINARAGGS